MTDDAPTWYLQGIFKNKNKIKKSSENALGDADLVSLSFSTPF